MCFPSNNAFKITRKQFVAFIRQGLHNTISVSRSKGIVLFALQ